MARMVVLGLVFVVALLCASEQTNADWLCGPVRCVWVHHHVASVPAFATGWPAPIHPNCFWKHGILGRWKSICP
jgi:hypothetical protein